MFSRVRVRLGRVVLDTGGGESFKGWILLVMYSRDLH